jgi:hypothetical protein
MSAGSATTIPTTHRILRGPDHHPQWPRIPVMAPDIGCGITIVDHVTDPRQPADRDSFTGSAEISMHDILLLVNVLTSAAFCVLAAIRPECHLRGHESPTVPATRLYAWFYALRQLPLSTTAVVAIAVSRCHGFTQPDYCGATGKLRNFPLAQIGKIREECFAQLRKAFPATTRPR